MSVLALAAAPGTSGWAVPLLQMVGRDADVVSWQQCQRGAAPAPDAVLVTTVDGLDGLPDVPVAVWVDSAVELDQANRAGTAVVLCRRTELVELGALLVPPVGVDLGRWPLVPPPLRQRWRTRHGLPSELVVGTALPSDRHQLAGVLALASVAVLTGPAIALALALGTPLVTNAQTAQRVGLRPGIDVEVTLTGDEAAATARTLAADEEAMATYSRRGRRFAERHLDLVPSADTVRDRLGLGPLPASIGVDRAVAGLDELATASAGPLRLRFSTAVQPLTAGAQP